jgi:monothiol glutaredoxin
MRRALCRGMQQLACPALLRSATLPSVALGRMPVSATLTQRRLCSSGEPPAVDELPESLKATIRNIIGQARIVVFLTGTPEIPRCRFTNALVDILRQVGVKYSYYDILQDDEVCEGLKVYSSWPTYPQVYIDGELIGGYDVTKQLLLSGELTKMLKAKDLL